jgi:hypothetical protein
VNQLQDQFQLRAGSAAPLPPLAWDRASLQALTSPYEQEATRHLAAAAAWGLFPEQHATYLNDNGTFTVCLGSREACGEAPNRLDTSEGWNFLMRVHRPCTSVLDGSDTLPAVEPVPELT